MNDKYREIIENIIKDLQYMVLVDMLYREVIDEYKQRGELKMVGLGHNPYLEEAHRRAKEIIDNPLVFK
jgi:hypothetical protein